MNFLMNLNEATQLIIQLLVLLGCLFYGAKKGGLALGVLGGLALWVYVFLFELQPGKPATSVIFTIVAVVLASSALSASGGLKVMLQIAEKMLRRHPKFICILAPVISWILTILCGTGHTVYTLLPIIYDVAIKNGIRPERPLAASTVSSQMGIIASPVSVAGASMVGFLLVPGVNLEGFSTIFDLLKITIPATFIGVLMIGTYSIFRGKDLKDDKDFQELIKDPEQREFVYGETATLLGVKLPKIYWASMWIFLAAIACVALLGYFESLRPAWEIKGKIKHLGMTDTIQIFMLLAATIIIIVSNVKSSVIANDQIFKSGMIALVAVYGISWAASTMFGSHTEMLKTTLGDLVRVYPWTYAVAALLLSKFINSQGAAIATLVPLALSIGVQPGIILGFASACYGYFILPTYPSDLAAIQFDRSGTTKIGKYVINHSFIIPGFIGVITSCIVGYILSKSFGYL